MKILAVLIGLLVPLIAVAGTLDVSWIAPTTNVNGSPLTNLATYRVYWYLYPNTPCPGTQFLVVNAPATTATVTGLTGGLTYSMMVTAVNSTNNESACSNMASGTVTASASAPPMPGPPIMGTPTLGATRVTLPVTWTPSVDPTGPVNYLYSGGLNDGTGAFSGISATPGTALDLAYHASGLAQPGWMCAQAQNIASNLTSENACGPITLPAKPVTTTTFILTTAKTGTGTGTITGSGAYPSGTTVSVQQIAAPGSTFSGWSGACTGIGPCSVVMTADKAVTATFTVTGVTSSMQAKHNGCRYVFTVLAPAGTTSVQLYKNGVKDGSPDTTTSSFAFTRTYNFGTYDIKADLTPTAVTRTFTAPLAVTCP